MVARIASLSEKTLDLSSSKNVVPSIVSESSGLGENVSKAITLLNDIGKTLNFTVWETDSSQIMTAFKDAKISFITNFQARLDAIIKVAKRQYDQKSVTAAWQTTEELSKISFFDTHTDDKFLHMFLTNTEPDGTKEEASLLALYRQYQEEFTILHDSIHSLRFTHDQVLTPSEEEICRATKYLEILLNINFSTPIPLTILLKLGTVLLRHTIREKDYDLGKLHTMIDKENVQYTERDRDDKRDIKDDDVHAFMNSCISLVLPICGAPDRTKFVKVCESIERTLTNITALQAKFNAQTTGRTVKQLKKRLVQAFQYKHRDFIRLIKRQALITNYVTVLALFWIFWHLCVNLSKLVKSLRPPA